MSKIKTKRRCSVKGCKQDSYYQGFCLQYLNPLLAPGHSGQVPVRYWPPIMEQATAEPEETRDMPVKSYRKYK